MKDIKLVIFDLDGTLIDAYAPILASFNYVMRTLNYPVRSAYVIRRAVGRGDAGLLQPFVKSKDLKRALSLYRRHHRTSLLRGSRLFPGVRRVLTYLKNKGYAIAVASNRPTEFSWILIRHLDIARYFHHVLCADKLRRGKPDPDILDRIRRHFNLEPNNVLYVGDMSIDAEAARRAMVKAILVTTGSSTRAEIAKKKPYLVIRRIERLLKIL